MAQVKIGRWGDDLAVRLPHEVAQTVALQNGDSVEIDTGDDSIVIRRTRLRVGLAELFQGKTAREWRTAYAGAYDWGPDFGREIVPD